MRLFRSPFFSFFIFSILWLTLPQFSNAGNRARGLKKQFFKSAKLADRKLARFSDEFSGLPEFSRPVIVPTPADGGIRELVAGKFRQKYEKWKEELFATEFGRRQWEQYASNKRFVLNISINDEAGRGAGTGDYKWNEAGELVEATIYLGSHLDKGFPNPIYYPVMNSLSLNELSISINGNILAATKIAHEFGHINLTAQTKSELFQRQNSLMTAYNKILLSNGYNTKDPRLVDLAKQMDGTPVKIWENREYWGETNAMLYILDRLNKENFYCFVFNKIKSNVEIYARDYEDRFDRIAAAKESAACRK